MELNQNICCVTLPSQEKDTFYKNFEEAIKNNNTALNDYVSTKSSCAEGNKIVQCLVLPSNIVLRFENGRVGFFNYTTEDNRESKTPPNNSTPKRRLSRVSLPTLLRSRQSVPIRTIPGSNSRRDMEVPEELITTVHNVLQRPRTEIIRELRMTNLDPNMAINNILSRESGEDRDSFHPNFLLSSVIPAGTSFRELASERYMSIPHMSTILSDRGNSSREISNLPEPSRTISSKVIFGDVIVFVKQHKSDDIFFSHIAALYSELLLVEKSSGKLFTIKWSCSKYRCEPSPRSSLLGLDEEEIVMLAASPTRAACLTKSGKIASWMDDCFEDYAVKAEHAACCFPQLDGEKVVQLCCSPSQTLVLTNRSHVFWWGIKLLSTCKIDRLMDPASRDLESKISVGSKVYYHNMSIYIGGAIAFSPSLEYNSPPKTGYVVNNFCPSDGNISIRPILCSEESDYISHKRHSINPKYGESEEVSIPVSSTYLLRRSPVSSYYTVIMVDNDMALIRLGRASSSSESDRIVKMCDLEVVPCMRSYKRILNPVQKCPVMLKLTACGDIYDILYSKNRLNLIAVCDDKPHFVTCEGNIVTKHPLHRFMETSRPKEIELVACAENMPIVMRDRQDGSIRLFPITNKESAYLPSFLKFPATDCVGSGSCSVNGNPFNMIVFIQKRHVIMPIIQNSDHAALKELIISAQNNYDQRMNLIDSLLTETCDGNRNPMHVAVITSREETEGNSATESKTSKKCVSGKSFLDEEKNNTKDRDSLYVLEMLCKSQILNTTVTTLLSRRDVNGFTPLVYSLIEFCYGAALMILGHFRNDHSLVLNTLLNCTPVSPLHVICQNDSCTYSLTSSATASQTLYECRTCNITKNFCCCANCAVICHRGHDCILSKEYTSGFCDCHFHCKCRAMNLGSHRIRFEVFKVLLEIEGVVDMMDDRNEHILLSVTAALRKNSGKENWGTDETARRLRNNHREFVENVFNYIIFSPHVLESFVTSDCRNSVSLGSQRECGSIDKFCYNLIFKITKISIDDFAAAIKQLNHDSQCRFMRSFVRIYMLLSPYNIFKATSKMDVCQAAFTRLQGVFGNIPLVAANELVYAGTSIITPILLGISLDDAFAINDYKDEKNVLTSLEDIFNGSQHGSLDTQALDADKENDSSSRGNNRCPIDENYERYDYEDVIEDDSDDDSSPTRIEELLSQLEAIPEENGSRDLEYEQVPNEGEMSNTFDDMQLGVEGDSEDEHSHLIEDSSESISDWTSSSSIGIDVGVQNFDGLVPDNLMWAVESDQVSGGREIMSDSQMKTNTCIYYSYMYSLVVVDAAQLMSLAGMSASEDQVLVLKETLSGSIGQIWSRVLNVFESLEARIRFGIEMWDSGQRTKRPTEDRGDNSEGVTLKDSLTRLLQLMRSQSNEQYGQMLTSLNLGSHLHYAFFFDSIAYFYQVLQGTVNCSENSPYARFFKGECQSNSRRCFFRRSNSVSSFTNDYNDILDTEVGRALPLALMPHLLTPLATKDILFGESKKIRPDLSPNSDKPTDFRINLCDPLMGQNSLSAAMNVSIPLVLKKFYNTIDLFAQLHLDQLDKLPQSTICQFSRFRAKDHRFRTRMSCISYKNTRSVTFEVERDHKKMLVEVFNKLNEIALCDSSSSRPQLITLNKIDAIFKNEPGRGEGVVRCFFTILADALTSNEPLPAFSLVSLGALVRSHQKKNSVRPEEIRSIFNVNAEPYNPDPDGCTGQMVEMAKTIYRRVRHKYPALATKITGMLLQFPDVQLKRLSMLRTLFDSFIEEAANMLSDNYQSEPDFDNSPLFWQPGKVGVFAPFLGKGDTLRLNAFLNVGRIIGLCLLFSRVLPIHLCRHVLKYIINREISWHDFAFYNPILYESLRKMCGFSCEEMDSLCLTFNASIDINKTSFVAHLKSEDEPVTVDNVREYVRLYSMYCMVTCCEPALQKIRQGVLEVVPADLFDHLSSEDLSLILSGVRSLDLSFLISVTTIANESGTSNVDTFVSWFWNIFERMDTSDKHDLLYFWTSSPFLPSSNDGFPSTPSISVRPLEDCRYPTANTCICRLYLPLYSSKAMLKSKLLSAISVKTFGFI